MIVSAYIALHYGREYLRQAVEALEPFVGRIVVAYTDVPSYGHGTELRCPDTEDELKACCLWTPKCEWHRGRWGTEGEHRAAAMALVNSADVVLVADADEVWDPACIETSIRAAADGASQRYGVSGFVHFWRSFNRCCRDTWRPVRVICPKGANREVELPSRIYHFGYAQREEIIRYKMSCHGHIDEWRKDWLDAKFLANAQTDIHPTVLDWWNAQEFDRTTLPEIMRKHPYYRMDLIR